VVLPTLRELKEMDYIKPRKLPFKVFNDNSGEQK